MRCCARGRRLGRGPSSARAPSIRHGRRVGQAVQVEVPAMAQFIEGEVSIVAASSREGDEPRDGEVHDRARPSARAAARAPRSTAGCRSMRRTAPRRERPKPMWNGPRAPPSAAAGGAAPPAARPLRPAAPLRVMLKPDDGAAPPRLAIGALCVAAARRRACRPGRRRGARAGHAGRGAAIIGGLLRRAFAVAALREPACRCAPAARRRPPGSGSRTCSPFSRSPARRARRDT